MRAAINPSLQWDKVHPQLWLQVKTPPWPNMGERTDSGHVMQQMPVASGSYAHMRQFVQPRLFRWEFRSQEVCNKISCYRHECPFFDGAHTFSACTQSKPKG